MLCPNCAQALKTETFDSQNVLHCSVCGASFFEKDGLAKLSKDSARQLADDLQGHYILGTKKLCPKDGGLLTAIESSIVPKGAVLLECVTCKGNFVYADDLLRIKGLNFSSAAAAPLLKLLPPPKSLFMLASFVILSMAVLLNYQSISSNMSIGSKAKDLVTKVTTTTDEQKRYLFFYFKTEAPVTSQVIFVDKQTSQIVVKEVSSQAKTTHQLTTSELDLTHPFTYQIVLKTIDGHEEKTGVTSLELK